MTKCRVYAVLALSVKGMWIASLTVGTLVSASAYQVLTLDQIVDKNEAVVGGSEAIGHVQGLRITSNASFDEGTTTLLMTILLKRPNLTRTDTVFQGKAVSSSFDGKTAWVINPSTGAPAPLELDVSANPTSFQIDMMLGSLRGISAGQQLQLIGDEETQGKKTHHIRAVRTDGVVTDYFVSTETFLIVKSETRIPQSTGEEDFESFPTDFRKVNGLMLPYSLDIRLAGHSVFQMRIQQIDMNPIVDDKVFNLRSADTNTPKS